MRFSKTWIWGDSTNTHHRTTRAWKTWCVWEGNFKHEPGESFHNPGGCEMTPRQGPITRSGVEQVCRRLNSGCGSALGQLAPHIDSSASSTLSFKLHEPGGMSSYRVLSILRRTKQHSVGGHAAGSLPGTAGWDRSPRGKSPGSRSCIGNIIDL